MSAARKVSDAELAVNGLPSRPLKASRPRVLLLSMYPLDRGVWGPIARIGHLRDELDRLVDLEVIAADRGARRGRLLRHVFAGRLRGLDGIYVENSSTLPSEADLAFLALARLLRIPVLTYVRDAQYLFDEYYAATSLKRRVARFLFVPAIALLRWVSTRVGYPSHGLAVAVRDPDPEPLLLPPGSPPPAGVPRRADARALLFVGGMRYAVHGLDLLVGAVERVRAEGHDLRVICVSRPGEEPPDPRPGWLSVERGAAEEIRALLPDVLATIQPRHRSPYNDLAVPIKVMEYLSYGRPLVVTDCLEQARIVREAGAGIVAADDVESLADGLRRLATAPPEEMDRWSANATAAAERSSWAARARAIVDALGVTGR
jgi:glycosyltransferase involved in cell wall biosynthesis